MKRRRFITGLGLVSASGVGIVGSGAVSNITTKRSIEVNIAPDFDTASGSGAYLEIDDTSDIAVPNLEKEVLKLDFTKLNDVSGGDGFNSDSTYVITEGSDGVFQLRNQSDRPLEIAAVTVDSTADIQKLDDSDELPYNAESTADDGPEIELFDVENPARTAITDENPHELSVGDTLPVGTRIIIPDIGVKTYTQTLLLQAREL